LDGEILTPVSEQELANSMASGVPNFSSSQRSLCDLGVSAVNKGLKTLTAESQENAEGAQRDSR